MERQTGRGVSEGERSIMLAKFVRLPMERMLGLRHIDIVHLSSKRLVIEGQD